MRSPLRRAPCGGLLRLSGHRFEPGAAVRTASVCNGDAGTTARRTCRPRAGRAVRLRSRTAARPRALPFRKERRCHSPAPRQTNWSIPMATTRSCLPA
ncbi:hypothetical protein C8240_02245 [Paracidovorax cattleyae]|nr:hypothetical protein C8240_02245 [Paracidovorax cattleyae]